MLKRLLVLIFIAAALNGYTQEQPDYNVENIPSALKSRANAVIRNMATTVDMRAPENVILNVKKAITVLNKNGEQAASLYIFYNKATSIKSAKGIIMDAFGKPTGKFSLSNFLDESAVNDFSLFEDARIKKYVPNVLSYPYTIIYEYEIRYKQNLIIPDWYATPYSDVSVEKNTYTFISKPDDKIRVKEYNYKGSPEVEKTDKLASRTWKVNDLSALKREPYAPDPDNYLTYVKIAPEQFTYYGHKGNYSNWQELGKWVYDDLVKTRQTLSPDIIQEMNDLVKGLNTDKEKAKKIYEYVQKKTRYISVQIGIGGFQPFEAAEVHRVSYGDCKALVNYTQSLLKAVGINSLYCVVYGDSYKKSMDVDFASMDQGNHIILCVPLKNDTTWLECTSQDSPFGYLGSFTDDRIVLACTEQGGKLIKTPILTTAASLLKRKAELNLDKDGNVNGKLQTNFSGSQYDNYRRIIGKPTSEQLKLLKEEYDIDNIDFSNLKLTQKKDSNPVTSESLDFTIQKYAPRTNNRIYMVLNAFNKTNSIPEVRNRTLPVYVNRGFTDEDEIVYNVPEGYSIEAKPEDREIKSPFGSYTIKVKMEGKKLTYNRKFVLNNGTYPADTYENFMRFFSDVSSSDNGKVVFKTD
ncbi:DUF3857 domain-containing protein [Pedobacter sp. B4-66]|uniref:DUF3857 domain-containing protein n=1 Tax=Pedobacter sp. B4-66 TaxID=2817280 RepID=UPI001BDA4643|nr:DUF3857 domain-containing protein [Pedobacter sp. B4-66]